MADVSDVCNTLVGLIAGLIYPNGTGEAPAGNCPPTKVYYGWPLPEQLQSDLEAGTAHVSVYPRPEERNTTRYPLQWRPVKVNTPTLTLTVSGQAVTVGGTLPGATNPHNLAIAVDGVSYVYAVQLSDTLATIAAALAALIDASVPGTTSSGPVITLPAAALIQGAIVGITGSMIEEVRRQERLFQIGIWADTPQARDAIAQLVDPTLAVTYFLTLPDCSAGRLRYKSSAMSDLLQKEQLYRRDLLYTCEYATTLTTPATEVVSLTVDVAVALQPPATPSAPAPGPVTVEIELQTSLELQTEAGEVIDTEAGEPLQTET